MFKYELSAPDFSILSDALLAEIDRLSAEFNESYLAHGLASTTTNDVASKLNRCRDLRARLESCHTAWIESEEEFAS